MDNILLTAAALFTSMLTAVFGLGGGVILILLMPGLMPLSAIVPVHAIVQSVSNSARVAFAWQHVSWSLLPPLLLGSVLGAALGAQAASLISLAWLPAVAGVLIIIITWAPVGRLVPAGRWAMLLLGFYQTGLGMLAGATGPLGAAVLSRISHQREWLVTNTGLYMTLNHSVRSAAFFALGFSFSPWWLTIVLMSAATIVGTWVGTRLRQYLPQHNFHAVFRWLVTLLAVRMVWVTAVELSA